MVTLLQVSNLPKLILKQQNFSINFHCTHYWFKRKLGLFNHALFSIFVVVSMLACWGNERKDIFLLGMRKRDKFASQQLELIDGYVVAMRRVWNWLVRYPYFKTRALCPTVPCKSNGKEFRRVFPLCFAGSRCSENSSKRSFTLFRSIKSMTIHFFLNVHTYNAMFS